MSFRYLSAVLTALLALSPHVRGQEIRLSNKFVGGIGVDREDRIWVATEEGLNCYDGIRNRAFLKYDTGLPANQLNYVFCDRVDPYIWIATRKSGLCRYDTSTDTFTTYLHDPEDLSTVTTDDITYILQDDRDRIWVSTFSEGIDLLDKATGTFKHFNSTTLPGFRRGLIQRFLVRDNLLYIGYWEAGLSVVNLSDGSSRDFRHDPADPGSLPSDNVRALFFDPGGNLWIGTTEGLALYSRSEDRFIVFRHDPADPFSLPEGAVYDINITPDQQLLVGIDGGGVVSLDLKDAYFTSGKRRFVSLFSGIRFNRSAIRALSFDRFGNLWIGTFGEGIFPFSTTAAGVLHLRYPYHLSAPSATALSRWSAEEFLVGNNTGRLDILHRDRSEETLREPVLSGAVQAIRTDREGKRWMGSSEDGITILSGRRTVHTTLGQEHLDVRAFLEDGDTMWAGTGSGLYQLSLRDGTVLHRYTRTEGLSDNLVRALAKDRAGRLWVGTYGKGITVFGPGMDSLTRHSKNTGFISDTVNDLLVDADGRIWAATSEGLARFEGDYRAVSQVYTRRDGLANDHIRALVPDNEGNLWMSTHNGVSCLGRNGRIANFDHRDGLPDGNYLGGSVTSLPEGVLAFGSTDGLGLIRPKELLARRSLPPVVFRTRKEDLSVGPRHGPLTVEFCIPDYILASRVEYAYRIPSLDPAWHECSNELTFNQPPYGKYTLEVRARLHNQDWSPDISSIHLSVSPPFWLSKWALALYALLLGALVVLIIRRQRRNLEKEYERDNLLRNQQISEERLQFYTNITHELRTPLTLIIGPLDELSESKDVPAPAREKIGKVKQSAHQLLALINQLLEFRKTETNNKRLSVSFGNLSTFAEELFARFSELSENNRTAFVSQVEPDVNLWFDPDVLTTILNNLLSNAVKYTPEGKITLLVKREENNRVSIHVQDTGYGIPEKSLSRIFDRYYQAEGPHQASGTGIGLSLVKSLCDLHRIGIKLSSQVGAGTTVTLLLDAGESYPDAEHTGEQPTVETPVPEPISQPEPLEDTDLRPLVLVVEDNVGICDFIRDSLSDAYRVATAHDGKEGLALALKRVPDIIISDIMMPVMDGIAFCKAVKNDIVTSHIPVILLTAKSSTESRKEGYDVGADSYIVKPFNKALLVSRIQNILGTRARLAEKLSQGESPKELSSMDNSFLQRFSEQVEASLQDNAADVESIAEALCMSPSTLYRKIKGLTGISPNEYIRNLKLNKAAHLLRTTDLTVAEIAYQCGMGSAVYFRNCFKERFGKTPTEYRSSR